MRRREFILVPAKALSGLMLSSLLGELIPAAAQDTVRVGLRFFTAAEAKVIQAASERIFPSDENGPGASEAGVVIYIDRQLAGPYGRDKYRYTKGPWMESVPEHGYQGKETPQQIYRSGIGLLGNDFAALPPEPAGFTSRKDSGFSLLSAPASTHDRGHVLRSAPRRQHRYGWLENDWLSRARA